MKVALMLTKDTLRARYLLECFEEGARLHGDECVWLEKLADADNVLGWADVGVQVAFPNKNHKRVEQSVFRERVNDTLYARGKRVVTIDTAALKNQSDFELKVGAPNRQHEVLFSVENKDTYERVLLDVYYSVGFDGLKGDADYCNAGSPPDRWEKLGVPLKPWRREGRHILVIGQTFNGLSTQDVDLFQWYADTLAKLRKCTGRPVVIRQHPRITKIRTQGQSRTAKDRAQIVARVPKTVKDWGWGQGWFLEDDLVDAWAAVTLTSNAGPAAVVEGIPVFTDNPTSMAYPVAHHRLKAINYPVEPDRTQWAHDLAYTQFNSQELKDGVAWQHLRPHALKPPKRSWRD